MGSPQTNLTIGIPVFNEAPHLTECLNHCLDQKAVILISDNGSTDMSGRICKEFSEKHSQAHLFSQKINRGSLWNFGYLLERCETDYFMWVGAHDYLTGIFGSVAVQELEDHPQAGFCAPRYKYFLPGGQPAGQEMDWEPVITDPQPWHRFRRFLQVVNRFTLIYSVFRADLAKEAWKAACVHLTSTPGPDILFMAWILLRAKGIQNLSLSYHRRLAQNLDAGDYQEKIFAAGAKRNLSPKDTGKQLIRIAESCPLLTWGQKKATVYFVVQKWGRPRGWHPLHLGIYLFSQMKKAVLPRLRHLNNRLCWFSGNVSQRACNQDQVAGSQPDWVERFVRPDGPKSFGKIGTTELLAIEYQYRLLRLPLGWKRPAQRLYFDSGVFPATAAEMRSFTRIYQEAIAQLDGICLWQPEGFLREVECRLVQRLNPRAFRITVRELSYPFVLSLPPCRWLVVSPFSVTMKNQLSKLPQIHPQFKVEPEVIQQCRFVQAPSFPWHHPPAEKTWSRQLKALEKEILTHSFDLAVVGAGAYSLPLLASIKAAGRKVIHLGGETQLLFGIKGRRWDGKNLYNEHWVRPSPDETPSNFIKKENGCYW